MKVEKKLNALHEMLCDELTNRLKHGEGTDAEGNVQKVAPATLNVIRQFLRDNNIEGLPDDDSPMAELLKELPDSLKKSFNTEH